MTKHICTKGVSRGFRSYACGKTAKHDNDENGNPTRCGIHCQAKEEKRKVQREESYQAFRAESAARQFNANMKNEALLILRKIAAGDNSPRELAVEWVQRVEQGVKG